MKGTSFVEVRIIPQPEYTKNALFSGRFWGVLKPPIQKPSTNLREKGSFDPICLNPREPLFQHHLIQGSILDWVTTPLKVTILWLFPLRNSTLFHQTHKMLPSHQYRQDLLKPFAFLPSVLHLPEPRCSIL